MMASPYRVLWSPRVSRDIREISSKADASLRLKIAEILRKVEARLSYLPETFGEIYSLKGPIAQHLGIADFLSFDVAIDEKHRLVVVRNCVPLSGRGLD